MFTKTAHSKPEAKSNHHPVFQKANVTESFVPAIQTKLEIGSSDSIYEVEADRMADRVSQHHSLFQSVSFVAPTTTILPEVQPIGSTNEENPQELADELLPEVEGQQADETQEAVANPPEEKPESEVPDAPDKSIEKPSAPEATKEQETQEEEQEEVLQEEEKGPEITVEDAAAFQGEANMEPTAKIEITPELTKSVSQASPDDSIIPEEKGEEEQEQGDELIQAKFSSAGAEEEATAGADIEGRLSSPPEGKSLPEKTRAFMEQQFHADFSQVQIHTGQEASELNNQLRAKAFTHKNHIYFNTNQFKPSSREGQHLLAHELTHTVQQGAVVQRKEISTTSPKIQKLGIGDALDYFADKAYHIPGYRMFTIILGINPINMSSVDRSAGNIIRAMVEFLPGGYLITQALDNHGVFSRVSSWFKEQMDSLSITGSSIRSAINRFLDSLSWSDIFDLADVWRRAKEIFTTPINRLISFAKSLVKQIMDWVKDAILRPLALLAEGTPAYDLLRVVLGRDPITDDPYPPTADNLIGGFMKLIGQEEIWENIKKGNAIERAFAWLQGALSGLMSFVTSIPTTIIDTIKSLTWDDIVLVPNAFIKIGKAFLNVGGRFLEWAGGTVLNLLEILFSVVAPAVVPWLKKAGAAFNSILRNPVGFIGNLVQAAKNGFMKFAQNIAKHLKAALINWLMGSLAGAGVYIPQSLSIKEIIKFVMSVLGVTWANVRQKLAKHLGEPAVKALETGFEMVQLLLTKGPMALWERLKEQLSDLKAMVIGEISSWVVTKVVTKAITKLMTSLNPAGAVIQAILFIYDTITFLIDKISQIARVGMAVLNSISAIANGIIQTAIQKVEQTLAGMLSLAISFLAKFLGLGKISEKIISIVKKIQKKVDSAIDKVVGWIVGKAKKFLKKIVSAGVPKDPKERLKLGMKKAVSAVNKLSGKKLTEKLISPVLGAIRARYEMKTLRAFVKGKKWHLEGIVNPKSTQATDKEVSSAEERLLAIAEIIIEATSTSRVLIPKAPEKTKVQLVRTDISLNKKIVTDLINKSSVPAAQKAAKIARATGFVDKAGQSESEAQIYYLLRQAQKVVNDIYGATAASLPNLEAHHIDRVAENPATFESTKKNRIKAKLKRKISSLPKIEQDKIANRSEAEQKEIMNLWVDQIYEQEVEDKGGEKLDEISLVILPREIHRGAGDTSVHGAEKAAKKKEEALYEPTHTFDDFNNQ